MSEDVSAKDSEIKKICQEYLNSLDTLINNYSEDNVPEDMSKNLVYVIEHHPELLSDEQKKFLREKGVIEEDDVEELYDEIYDSIGNQYNDEKAEQIKVVMFESLKYSTLESIYDYMGNTDELERIFEENPQLAAIHFASLTEEESDVSYEAMKSLAEKKPSLFLDTVIENRIFDYKLESYYDLLAQIKEKEDLDRMVNAMKKDKEFANALSYLAKNDLEDEDIPELLLNIGKRDLSLLKPYFKDIVENYYKDIIELFIENDFGTIKENIDIIVEHPTDDILFKIRQKDKYIFKDKIASKQS